MDIIKYSIDKPVTVLVGVILIVLFGVISLQKIPYQLTPTVTEPEIMVSTLWPGATPYEIESDIIEEQEKVLKGIPGLIEMESSSFNSKGEITLRFRIGVDVNNALLRVSNKLSEVRSYPANVEKPVINASGAATSPVIWMVLKSTTDKPASEFKTFFENEVRQHFERVQGVADLFIGGGRVLEMHIIIDPEKLAAYGLTIRDLTDALSSENVNISAGSMGVGRREYRIRTVSEFRTIDDIMSAVIRSSGQRRILLSDVADVNIGLEKPTVAMLHNGSQGIAIGVKPEPGTNIIRLTDDVEKVAKNLNAGLLKQNGLYVDWSYDQRPYINGAINLVRNNIFLGGSLAIIVLLIFLRSFSSTIIIAAAIPISVVGTFIFLYGMGRNLNVVSLAGISFAVGMLADNAIVVLENIDRHKRMGKKAFLAALDGTKEVWGAILASTITTIAVFLPIIFMVEEAGQLFRDIAIAVTSAVVLSLFVSVSVIPMFAGRLTRTKKKASLDTGVLARIGAAPVNLLMFSVSLAVRNWFTRLFTISLLTALSVYCAVVLFPKMEYLPQGNRNLVINILIPPPGLSYNERQEIGEFIFEQSKPHIKKDHNGLPGIRNMFYVGSEGIMLFGATSMREQRAGELLPLFRKILAGIPGMFGISNQAGIFQRRLGRGRTIDIDISGENMALVVRAAGALFGQVNAAIAGSQVRPVPSLELTYPEVRILPVSDKVKAAGLSARDLGINVDVLMDGRKVGEYKREGVKKIDLVLKASDSVISTPEALYDSLIVTPAGKTLPLSSLADLVKTTGMTQIRHLERKRTITIQVTPPEALPMQAAMETIEQKILPGLKQAGLTDGLEINLSGAADKLTETRDALMWNFVLAAIIIYLLMSALFANFIYPLIIMFTVPLAAAGGFIGIRLVNLFIAPQPLDILTMLGFVILVGVVVNNAILIVHQSLNNYRFNKMDHKTAVLESTKSRLRPIYMSALTSIFGMLPLVIAPGPGSELYRGLGSVILGGLALSTILTVFIIPALMLFFIKMEKRVTNETQAEGI